MRDLRARFNRFVIRHEVAWELTMGLLAVVFLVIGFAVARPIAWRSVGTT